jgi:hypothetical protein
MIGYWTPFVPSGLGYHRSKRDPEREQHPPAAEDTTVHGPGAANISSMGHVVEFVARVGRNPAEIDVGTIAKIVASRARRLRPIILVVISLSGASLGDHEAALVGKYDSLGAVARSRLHYYPGHVCLDGGFADEEATPNLGI